MCSLQIPSPVFIALLDDDCHLTVRQNQYLMGKEMCIDCSHTTIHSIMKNKLALRKVCSSWVLRMLTEDHKTQCMAAVLDLLALYREGGGSMLDHIATGNETWVHHYPPPQNDNLWFVKRLTNHRRKNLKR